MISRVEGTLVAKDLDSLEVMTGGGVGYDVTIPLSVFEASPRVGEVDANCSEGVNTPIGRKADHRRVMKTRRNL